MSSGHKQRGTPTEPVHTARVAAFVAGLDVDNIPDAVLEHAKLDILDTLGCALFGRTLEISAILERALRRDEPEGRVSIWGSDWLASPATAALVNGTLVHSYELDDLHHVGILHPGGCALPAIVAVGELRGLTGRDLLAAHVAGLEIACRAGLAVGVPLLTRGWHNNGVLGVFASAAGGARALGLGAERTQHAIGVAGSLACGLMAAQYGAMVKRLHAGQAAQNGLRAALLAEEGFTGIQTLFEEPYGGYFSTFADSYDLPAISADLGERWETTNVGFKPYSACGSSHSTVDVIKRLQKDNAFAPSDVEQIRILSSTATRDHVGWAYVPDGPTSAQMNLPYAAAVTLLDGDCFVDQFTAERIIDPEVIELTKRVVVEADPDIDARGPRHRHEVDVTVRLADGRELHEHAVAATGSARSPLDAEAITRKYRKLVRHLGDRGEELATTVLSLDKADSIDGLLRLLRSTTTD